MNKAAAILLFLLVVSFIGNIHLVYRALDYRRGANEWLDKYTNVVEEYSRRSIYESENAKLRSDITVKDRMVFFGTQVVKRWDLQKYFPDYEAINRGISGQWVSGLLLRYYQDVIELKPEYVFIEISSYNLRPQFSIANIQETLTSMVELARYNNIKPVLSTMIPLRKDHGDFGDYSVVDSMAIYNDWLIAYCHMSSLSYIDLGSFLTDGEGFLRAELSSGPIDPNDDGYRLISERLLSILSQAD